MQGDIPLQQLWAHNFAFANACGAETIKQMSKIKLKCHELHLYDLLYEMWALKTNTCSCPDMNYDPRCKFSAQKSINEAWIDFDKLSERSE